MHSEDPNLPPVLSSIPDEATLREEYAQQALAQRFRSVQPRATIALIVVCAAVFGLEAMWADMGQSNNLINMGAMKGEYVRQGEWWRLWASTFLHIGPIHIGANMMVLWSLGRQMEALLGSRRFLILYALSGLAGGVACLLFMPNIILAGASGAIWGLLGGILGLTFRSAGLFTPAMAKRIRGRLVQPLAINIAISFLPGIGWMAHLGGGLAGLALVASGVLGSALNDSDENGRKPWSSQWVSWAAIGLCVAMGVSMVWAILAGQPWNPAGN